MHDGVRLAEELSILIAHRCLDGKSREDKLAKRGMTSECSITASYVLHLSLGFYVQEGMEGT